MISLSSIKEVRAILEKIGLYPIFLEPGQIEIVGSLTFLKFNEIRTVLQQNDFDLLVDKQTILLEKIKTVIIEMIYYSDELPNIKYSDYISRKLRMNYTYISKFFSNVKKVTIEQFIIRQKIERVKQLLLFNELSLTEIAWKLNYSSTAHLSAQFKKVTGLTPSAYKRSREKHIVSPENV